jgi:outer membrane protein
MSKVTSLNSLAVVLLALAAGGCAAVRAARDAQRAVAPAGADQIGADTRAKIDLRGRPLAVLVDFALTNRPSVVSARLAVEDARLALRQLAADAPIVSDTPWTAPHLSLSASHSEKSRGTKLDKHRFGTDGNAAAGLSLDLLVWDFGRYDAKAKAQAERVVSAERALLNEGFTVFGEVAKAYFTVMENRALLNVSFTNVAQFAEHLAQAEERLKAGEVNRLDVLRARLDLAKARELSVAASNNYTTAGAELMRALGIDAGRGTFNDVIGTPPGDLSVVTRQLGETTYTVDDAFAFARTNAPAVRLARAKLRAASHDVDAAVADLYPTLRVTTSLSWADPLWYWSWGVSAAQSLFEGFRRTTAVDRAVVAMRSAAAAVDAAEQNLSANIELAVAVRDNAREARRTARVSLQSARENLQMVTAQRAVGDVSRIELSDSLSEYSSALGSRVSAFYTGQRAEAALFALLGRYPQYKNEKVVVK